MSKPPADHPTVPAQAAEDYRQHLEQLLGHVSRTTLRSRDLGRLVGRNSYGVVEQDMQHHGHFLSSVMRLQAWDLVERTMPWVYRSHEAHGFTKDYFRVQFEAWEAAVKAVLPPRSASHVTAVYRWMQRRHAAWWTLAQATVDAATQVPEPWTDVQARFLQALLAGDSAEALALARDAVRDSQDLSAFYLYVVQASMEQIGREWERDRISEADEHVASAIVARVLAVLSAGIVRPGRRLGRAVVAAAPNEFHELGAWMVSDLLEQDGWDVRYLGANTPIAGLVRTLVLHHPHILFVSATVPFNLDGVSMLVETVRAHPELKGLKIMLGGQAFAGTPSVLQALGADGTAPDAATAVILAREWQATTAQAL